MNIHQKMEFEEIQDKINAINTAIEAGILYETYKTDLEPKLDELLKKRDKFINPQSRYI